MAQTKSASAGLKPLDPAEQSLPSGPAMDGSDQSKPGPDGQQPPFASARRNLHEQTADQIRIMILEGLVRPGARMSEKELCDRFEVSRTPVREALKALATEGLVTITPNRGATVTQITLDELADVFPILGALEALAGELAVERMSDRQIAGCC